MKPGNVSSHIQMPRFLLARFENKNHSFFYYDVEKEFVGTHGHAKSMNTEHGYYPDAIEKILCNEIEQPFSQILEFIDSLDLDTVLFNMTNANEKNIKQFMISLIVRSPLLLNGINRSSVFFRDFSPTDQHTIAVTQGFSEALRQRYFDSFHITLTVNKSNKPFILPICGLYDYNLNGYTHVSFPISPTIAITLIESAGVSFIKEDGITRMYLITQEKHALEFNKFAFLEQCKQNYGCVISPSKDALEELLPLCEEKR